jgi:hypothetical protein
MESEESAFFQTMTVISPATRGSFQGQEEESRDGSMACHWFAWYAAHTLKKCDHAVAAFKRVGSEGIVV